MAVSHRYPAAVQAAARATSRQFIPRAPFASINAAQWAIESDYGLDISGKNNFFGIKATPAQISAGKATRRLTHETIDGVYGPHDLYFADFDSPEECFRAHEALLLDHKMGWAYRDCWAAKTPEEYAMALQEHYATGIPGHPYGQTLIDTMKRDGLYDLDNASTEKPSQHTVPNIGVATTGAGAVVVATASAAPHVASAGLPVWLIAAIVAVMAGGLALLVAYVRAELAAKPAPQSPAVTPVAPTPVVAAPAAPTPQAAPPVVPEPVLAPLPVTGVPAPVAPPTSV